MTLAVPVVPALTFMLLKPWRFARLLAFLDDAPVFERMLVNSGIRLFKYYLDIDREEQKARLKVRSHDPLSRWKISPIDQADLNRCILRSRRRTV